ncbi:helix-turn-helix transcriptional regulator [Streptococcus parauberis]|nr:helix-turn-helix transcriptional regulator [Streptococcus parauberis]MDT2749606.1 helix-turn-helix transcriptional regulator [Streptococcus parauberis]
MIRQLFCESLKDYRIENQLTQSDLAKILGVTKQTVINYENGKTYP